MSSDIRRLQNLKVVSVGLVTKGANRQSWILFKDAEGKTMTKIKKSDLTKLTPTAIKKMGMSAGDAKKLLMAIEGSEESVGDATLEMLKRIAGAAGGDEEGVDKEDDADEGDDTDEGDESDDLEKDGDEDDTDEGDDEEDEEPVRKGKAVRKAVRKAAPEEDEDGEEDEDAVLKSSDATRIVKLLKAQKAENEELRKELSDQRDSTVKAELIRKSAEKWPQLPVKHGDLGEMLFKLHKLDKGLAKSLTAMLDRFHGVIEQSDILEKEFGFAGHDNEDDPQARVTALAKSMSKDGKMTIEQAEAAVYKTKEGREMLRQIRKHAA